MIGGISGSKKSKEISRSSENTDRDTRSLRRTNIRTIQNFLLVWLDSSFDTVKNHNLNNKISKLRKIINTIHTFNTVHECINFINNIKEEKIFMICSNSLGQIAIPIIHDMPHVSIIYIFGEDQARYNQWAKVKGVFTNIKSICEELKQATQECDQNTISMSFVITNDDIINKNLDQLDQSFMYTQIFKEILLTIDFEEQHFIDFINYCREQFISNDNELKNIDKIERKYHKHLPIWWYTYPCFLYSMLNRALRTMEIDLIITIGFFVRDLHKHIEQLYLEQYIGHTHSNTFIVYRGQGLSQTDFEQLVKTKNGLLSFNNFLSTSINRNVSLNFARQTIKNSNLIGILFLMIIDPSISSTPFANVRDVSYFQGEEEILFSMHSIFRIRNIQQIDDNNNRLWQVELTLTSDNDPDLYDLTENIRKETFPHAQGWYRLGNLLIKVGEYDKAEQVFEIMLDHKIDDGEEANIYHMLGIIKDNQGEYAQSITYYEKSIEINQKILSPTHSDLATSYTNIGVVYNRIGEYSKALLYHEKALQIDQKILPSNHPDLATSYNNIGRVYDNMGNYSKALSTLEKALGILEKTLPSNHPHFASTYNNIALVYDNIGEYSKALSFNEKVLEIRHKVLPPNHPLLATSYGNIGLLYNKMGEHSKALSFTEKAIEIYQKNRSLNHPYLATSYETMGQILNSMGEYVKALSSHEKALDIRQEVLPRDHPDLASSYSHIGDVYDNMDDYSKAFTYYERALDIGQRSLPANHPHLQIYKDRVDIEKNKL